jgi:Gram-negative bacterial TonB protein C-terminal
MAPQCPGLEAAHMSGKPTRVIAAVRISLILFAAAALLFCLARPSRILAAEPQTAAKNPASAAGAQANSPAAAAEPQQVPPARSQDQNAGRNPYRPAAVLSAADVVFPFKTTADANVIFSVSVGPGGQAEKITVLQDVPPFTAAAQESLKNWKFSAASFEDRPEGSDIPVAFVFRHAVYIANPPLFTPTVPAKESGRGFVPPGIVSMAYAGYPASTIAFGAVVVQVNIKADGSIGGISVARDLAGGFGPLAVDAAKHWKFQAASRDGRPVPGKVAIAFVFSSRSLNPF